MSNIIVVGMADLKIAKSPERLRTSGLGSCVGLVIYDPMSKVGGMAHIMLPSSQLAKAETLKEAKYADTAIAALLSMLDKAGGLLSRYQAKLAGGAQMFAFQSNNDSMRIGPRNVEECKKQLQQYNIPILAEDTGGNCGRTIELHVESGLLSIRTVNQGIKEV